MKKNISLKDIVIQWLPAVFLPKYGRLRLACSFREVVLEPHKIKLSVCYLVCFTLFLKFLIFLSW